MKYKCLDELGVVTRRSGISCYHQLYTLLERALTDGAIPAGSALPSETELMARFQVSRNTVRRALGQLVKERRIVRRRGSGSFARSGSPAEKTGTGALIEVWKDDDAMRRQTTSHLVRIQSGVTPEFIRRREPRFAERSLLIQRSRRLHNVPLLLVTSHVPQAIADGLTRRQLAQSPVLVALDALGVKAFSAEQTTTAVAADSITARHLGVDPDTALLCVYRLIRDGDGRCIEHQTILHRPDRYHQQETLLIERDGGSLTWLRTPMSRAPAWV